LRRKSKVINVGNVPVGGDNPVVVQSMTSTDTRDINTTVEQIKSLGDAGCEIVRVAVIDNEAALAIKEIKAKIDIPLVADIHFDYRLALQSIESGADGLRLNPGNIGSVDNIKKVVDRAKERSLPIRVGVNSGSLEKDILEKYGKPTAEALVESALKHVRILENLDHDIIKISIKSSDVKLMVDGYRLLAEEVEYPLHLGVTEAGTVLRGTVKSSVGLGILLSEGIGDTIRVSLTGPPETEVFVGYEILSALGLRKRGMELISCPTCGRCQVDLITMAEEVERRLAWVDKPIKVAVMGCPVNGPGEAKHCDVGIAGGNEKGLVFRKGEIVANVPQEKLVDILEEEIIRMLGKGD